MTDIKLNPELCIKCGICEKICVRKAIDIEKRLIDKEKCFGCSQCITVCKVCAISINDKTGEFLDFKGINSDDFKKMIILKRSVRFFSDKEIDENILKDIAEIVKFSPTAKNQQEVNLTIVRDKETLKKTTALSIKYFKKLSSLLNRFSKPFLTLITGKRNIRNLYGLQKLVLNYEEGKDPLLFNAKALFIFHAEKKSTMAEADCNIAASYSSLYAESLGLGSCYNGYLVRSLNGSNKLRRELMIPENHKVFETFVLGYPLYKYQNSPVRDEKNITII
ncbi:MAG TPA: nitroreductase family protein [Spirochaetota bacterium]|nr:nitroreductase family protein [Spirochaetota bacterium]